MAGDIQRTTTLPDSASKANFHSQTDEATIRSDKITNAMCNSSMELVATKLAQIDTANKVTTASIVGTPWPDGFILGYELTYFDADATAITLKQGVAIHGITQAKTTAPSSALTLDTAANYYDGNLADYSTEGWNYMAIDTSGNFKLLGANPPDKSSYVTDGTIGDATGTLIYFWDSGNTKHWRVVGTVRCYEDGGVIKAKWGQAQNGNTIMYSAGQGSGTTDQTSFTELNLNDGANGTLPEITEMGIFNVQIAATGNGAFHVKTADAAAGAAGKVFNSDNGAESLTVDHEFLQITDGSQKIDYKIAGTSPTVALTTSGYVMNIR